MAASQSQKSLKRSEAGSEPYNSNKFKSQAIGGNKKRAIVKKGGKGAHKGDKEHFDLGMRHLAQLHQAQNSEKFSSNQATTSAIVANTTKRLKQQQK